jgi:hypothetical protein
MSAYITGTDLASAVHSIAALSRNWRQWRLFGVDAQSHRHQDAGTTLATALGVQLVSHIAAAVENP